MTSITPAQILECWHQPGDRLSLNPGDVLFHAGEAGSVVFGLLHGELELQQNGTLEVIQAGDVVGEESLLFPDHQRFATAIARTPAELVFLDRERFLFAIQTGAPTLALAIMASLSERLRHLKA
jgi:CRP/FNR family transcriptional regulator, cyclic AMP receptor protein